MLAEAESWPLRAALASRLRTTRLRRSAPGILDAATSRLASGLEEHLRLRAGGMSLASLSALRDRCWFVGVAHEGGETLLADYAVRLARTHLACAGPRTVLRADVHATGLDAVDRAAHWRWLSLCLPADFLVSALHAADGTRPPADHVSLGTDHLARVLEQPVAETHLHAGAAFGFPLLWTAWMEGLSREDFDPRKFGGGTGSPSSEEFAPRKHLLVAALSRVLLASFLWHRERGLCHQGFDEFEAAHLPGLCQRVGWQTGAVDAQRLCARVLSSLLGQDVTLSLAHVRMLYSGMISRSSRACPRTLEELRGVDPLAEWLRPSPGEACAEVLFSTRALGYLLREGRGDGCFAELFWQYARLRALAHSHFVQEPGTQGLDWFGRHYRRLSPVRSALEGLRFEAALQHQSLDLKLGALEARTSPLADWRGVRDEVRALARAGLAALSGSATAVGPELGLIFHFIKEREHRLWGKPRLHADPGADPAGFRFGVWFRSRRQEVLAIQTALHHHPELLLLLRGVDVASTELAVPTWATAPLLNALRDASMAVAVALSRRRPSWRVAPLRVTCHAGEEFGRLVEGLRRVHELLETGALQKGDRIGHGLALGTKPEQWAAHHGVVVQTVEDRLEDLLWELELRRTGAVSATPSRVERIRAEAVRLSRQVQGSSFQHLELLLEARRARTRSDVLRRLGFPDRRRAASPRDEAEALLLGFLSDVGMFRRGQEWVEVRVDEDEVVFLHEAQRWLRAKLARLEVTVESNPSSNLLIADMLGLEAHPMLRLMGLGETGAEQDSRLMVSLNSDDPITFATCLADEYAYIYYALLRQGLAPAQALTWMNTLREQGMRSRFTHAASTERGALEFLLAPASR